MLNGYLVLNSLDEFYIARVMYINIYIYIDRY